MDAVAAPSAIALRPGCISLGALSPGAKGVVVNVGSGSDSLTPLERRLLEFGFCSGEQVEVLAESRPGRDPFVVRVGNTTLALRRCEAENIWIEMTSSRAVSSSSSCVAPNAPGRVEISRYGKVL